SHPPIIITTVLAKIEAKTLRLTGSSPLELSKQASASFAQLHPVWLASGAPNCHLPIFATRAAIGKRDTQNGHEYGYALLRKSRAARPDWKRIRRGCADNNDYAQREAFCVVARRRGFVRHSSWRLHISIGIRPQWLQGRAELLPSTRSRGRQLDRRQRQ